MLNVYIVIPQFQVKKWANNDNKESIELYCLFIGADSIVDAIIFIMCAFYV